MDWIWVLMALIGIVGVVKLRVFVLPSRSFRRTW